MRQYWDVYYARVNELVEKYPKHVRLWPTEALNDKEVVKEILQFGGVCNRPIVGVKLDSLNCSK